VINSNKNCGDTGINKDFSTKLLIIYVLNYNSLIGEYFKECVDLIMEIVKENKKLKNLVKK
jgi:hypothetical protein